MCELLFVLSTMGQGVLTHYQVDCTAPAMVKGLLPLTSDVLNVISCRSYGVIVAAKLRPGMSTQEADVYIGKLNVEGGQSFGHKANYCFARYGFSVGAAPDDDGVWRVVSVSVTPLPFVSSKR